MYCCSIKGENAFGTSCCHNAGSASEKDEANPFFSAQWISRNKDRSIFIEW